MTMRWYVVQTTAQFENKVKEVLLDRIKLAGLDALFEEILIPTEEVVEMKSGQKRKSERKFFPGYILVKMELTDETWHLVRHVPRVSGFIGGRFNNECEASICIDRNHNWQRHSCLHALSLCIKCFTKLHNIDPLLT